MAIIGNFTTTTNTITGQVRTLTVSMKARLVPIERSSQNAPDFRIMSGMAEVGAGWKAVSEDGEPYISVIRARIKEVTGLNASAGISYCKFLAKMASDLNKPNGQAVITPSKGPSFVEALPVKRFHGVGPATAEKMERLGILTGADLKAKPLAFLQQHFGKAGGWYYRIVRGIDNRPVEPDRPRKSIGAEDTFETDLFDSESVYSEISALVAKVWRLCEAKQLRARTVTLKVKYADFQRITRSRTVSQPFQSAAQVDELSRALLDPLFPVEKGIRLVGVTVSSLEDAVGISEGQLALL